MSELFRIEPDNQANKFSAGGREFTFSVTSGMTPSVIVSTDDSSSEYLFDGLSDNERDALALKFAAFLETSGFTCADGRDSNDFALDFVHEHSGPVAGTFFRLAPLPFFQIAPSPEWSAWKKAQ